MEKKEKEKKEKKDEIKIFFVTGNENKAKEVNLMLMNKPALDHVEVICTPVDLPELQEESCEAIARAKCLLAYRNLFFLYPKAETSTKYVLTEDSSLGFTALGGLPGPYIKWFSSSIGNEGLVKLLQGWEDKSAHASTVFAVMGGDLKEPLLFSGKTEGSIVEPRASLSLDGVRQNGFGWDPIFEYNHAEKKCGEEFKPNITKKTFAEMYPDEKNQVSPRKRALDLLFDWIYQTFA